MVLRRSKVAYQVRLNFRGVLQSRVITIVESAEVSPSKGESIHAFATSELGGSTPT